MWFSKFCAMTGDVDPTIAILDTAVATYANPPLFWLFTPFRNECNADFFCFQNALWPEISISLPVRRLSGILHANWSVAPSSFCYKIIACLRSARQPCQFCEISDGIQHSIIYPTTRIFFGGRRPPSHQHFTFCGGRRPPTTPSVFSGACWWLRRPPTISTPPCVVPPTISTPPCVVPTRSITRGRSCFLISRRGGRCSPPRGTGKRPCFQSISVCSGAGSISVCSRVGCISVCSRSRRCWLIQFLISKLRLHLRLHLHQLLHHRRGSITGGSSFL